MPIAARFRMAGWPLRSSRPATLTVDTVFVGCNNDLLLPYISRYLDVVLQR